MTKAKEIPVVWLQGATCTGCSVSVLNSVSPTIKNVLIDQLIPGTHINLKFHATIMAGTGEMVIKVLEDTAKDHKGGYLLVVEGSIPTKEGGLYCCVGEKNKKPIPFAQHVKDLAKNALACVALGTCSAYGGIPAAEPNPSGAKELSAFLKENNISTPVINVPGCPPHPDWFLGTVATVILGGLPKPEDVDEVGRLKAFYGNLIHDNCPRRAHFDVGRFAKKFNEPGCLYELGCKGYVTYADCPTRLWNNGLNWCVGNESPCLGCVEPDFPDVGSAFYKKILARDCKVTISGRKS